jgi:lauroyl/myristoyl acyltransferase
VSTSDGTLSISALSDETLRRAGRHLPGVVELDLHGRSGGRALARLPVAERLAAVAGKFGNVSAKVATREIELPPAAAWPPGLRAAVDARGGHRALAESITWLVRHRASGLLRTLAEFEGTTDFPVRGDVLAADGGPALLVTPHLGPLFAVPLHLALLGARVVMPVYRNQSPQGAPFLLLSRIADLLDFPPGAAIRLLPVPHPFVGRFAHTAVRRGYSMVWQPDTTVGADGSRNTAELPLFGLRRRVSVLPYEMARRHGMKVVLGYSILTEAGTVRFEYRNLAPPMDDAESFFGHLAPAVEDAIVRHVEQWSQLRYFPDV